MKAIRPFRSPERSSSPPMRQEDQRLESPTDIIIRAMPMSKRSKAVNNVLSPCAFTFSLLGKFSYIESKSTPQKDHYKELVKSG